MFKITSAAKLDMVLVDGQLSLKISKPKKFTFSTIMTIIFINIYSRFGETPSSLVLISKVLMMGFIMSRMVQYQALTSAKPSRQRCFYKCQLLFAANG